MRRLAVVQAPPARPLYVVWELTLACDQPCTHCGSRAGQARAEELSTARALEVAHELSAMGAREVVLIGGEAYLHPGFLDIVRCLRSLGVTPVMTSGGRGISPKLAREMKQAGMQRVSVSLDGLEATHDLMRAQRGSFATATQALVALGEVGIELASNINLNRLNRADLEPLYEHLRALGVRSWQVQLTAALGRAADRPQMLLQPYDLLELVPRIAALKLRAFSEGMLLMPGNNLGYFGPEEGLLRSQTPNGEDHFQGCQAGRYVLGIESDGAVKGCPSLQTSHYVGGKLASASLSELWDTPEVAFTRTRGREALWGFCRDCTFAEPCLGGCTFTAHALLGRPGNQPYCHFRAQSLARRGLRERLVPTTAAPGEPFDCGRFELVEEPFHAPEPPLEARAKLVRVTRKPGR